MVDIMNQKLRAHWPKGSHVRQLADLEEAGCVTVGDVLNGRMSDAEMLRLPRVGRGTLQVLRHAVLKAVVEWRGI